jgi:hypothetical protein
LPKLPLLETQHLKDQLEAERAYLQEEIKLEYNHENIIGQSDGINYVLYKVEQIAASDTIVLVLGETGTGKELVARAIHDLSLRKGRALMKVNCATLPSNLIESELFGHEKGAFSGAHVQAPGAIRGGRRRPRFFSMRSASCRWNCSPSCSGSFRMASLNGWAVPIPLKSMCGLLPPPIETWKRKFVKAGSGKISGTV